LPDGLFGLRKLSFNYSFIHPSMTHGRMNESDRGPREPQAYFAAAAAFLCTFLGSTSPMGLRVTFFTVLSSTTVVP